LRSITKNTRRIVYAILLMRKDRRLKAGPDKEKIGGVYLSLAVFVSSRIRRLGRLSCILRRQCPLPG
jgi:hypothetical protein